MAQCCQKAPDRQGGKMHGRSTVKTTSNQKVSRKEAAPRSKGPKTMNPKEKIINLIVFE